MSNFILLLAESGKSPVLGSAAAPFLLLFQSLLFSVVDCGFLPGVDDDGGGGDDNGSLPRAPANIAFTAQYLHQN